MNCRTIKRELSAFLDEVLEANCATVVSEHLETCAGCRRELERLEALREALRSLGPVTAPDYLHHMLEMRLSNELRENWKTRLKEAWQYQWSRIRTTEGIWYLTRLAGTAMTFILFTAITAAMGPLYIDLQTSAPDRTVPLQQFRMNVLKNLGLLPLDAQRKPINPREPMLNDEYLVRFGQEVSRTGAAEDTFSVVAVVDRSGTAKIQNVLEYSSDSSLLSDFNDMISSARFRPASYNGRAVDSRLVFTFSKISVYD